MPGEAVVGHLRHGRPGEAAADELEVQNRACISIWRIRCWPVSPAPTIATSTLRITLAALGAEAPAAALLGLSRSVFDRACAEAGFLYIAGAQVRAAPVRRLAPALRVRAMRRRCSVPRSPSTNCRMP